MNRRLALVLAGTLVLVGAAGAGAAVMMRGDDAPPSSDVAAGSSAGPSAEPEPEGEPTWRPTEEQVAEARRTADGLTLPELAGQLIVARHFANETSLALVEDKHFAGVMVTAPQILEVATEDPLVDVKAFNDQLRTAGEDRGVPVVVPVDQEGGLVARLGAPLTTFPSFMTAGAAVAGDPEAGAEAVREAAAGSGAELRAAGYNAVFAPIGDLTIGPEDPIIGSRSAGSDPDAAAGAVAASVRGYGDAGLISSVKHFPGHNVDEDSHSSLPVLEGTREELDARDAKPFTAAIDVDAPSIMTGHLDVPAVDDGTPASMSREVVTGWLREDLGYEGLIVSDSLGMGPIMSRYPGGEAALAALKAGSDLALMPADNDAAHEAVLEALESGDLPEQQARDSATRTISWLLAHEASQAMPGEPGAAAEAAQALSTAGATVVTRQCDQPFRVRAATPVGDPATAQLFREEAAEAGLTIGGGTTVAFIGQNGVVSPGTVAVTTDTPYALADSDAPFRIALYGNGRPAVRALIDVLMGEAEPGGGLPVEIPGLEPTTC